MKTEDLRKIRFEILVAMLNDDSKLWEMLKTYMG